MPLPESVAKLAAACSFTVHGWDGDDDHAVIQSNTLNGLVSARPDVNFIGTKAECVAFMTAWQQCIKHKLSDLMTKEDSEEPRSRVRRAIMVLSTDAPIPPNQGAQIDLMPPRGPFRCERLAIPIGIAEHFSIVDLRVGNRSQLEMAGEIPGVTFAIGIDVAPLLKVTGARSGVVSIDLERQAQKEFGRKWLMETCQVAMAMMISVRNTSKKPRPFTALALGVAADY